MDAEKLMAMEKIMKMLELGKDHNGGTSAEQEAANTMAAKLMAKYAIDFSELRSMNPKGNIFEHHKIDPLDVVYCDWEAVLANSIAKAFDVRMVNTKHPVWIINFMGVKSDLEIVVFFYRHLRRTVCRKSELEFKRKADVETYAFGMVSTIGKRLEELYKKREEVMDSDCRAMVLVKTDGLQDYVKTQFPSLTTSRAKKLNGSSESYAKGLADGHKISLNRPIAGNSSAPQRLTRGH